MAVQAVAQPIFASNNDPADLLNGETEGSTCNIALVSYTYQI